MKKLLLILLCLPVVVLAQQTYVPDDNFEAYLEANGMGNGIANDDYVPTSSIDTITYLNVNGENISDLTGIEDFTYLAELRCHNNQLTTLNVSQNIALTILWCNYNQLVSLNLGCCINYLTAEGNLLQSLDLSVLSNVDSMTVLQLVNNGGTLDNPYLTCINVADTTLWNSPSFFCMIGPNMYFSTNCSSASLQEQTTNKEALKVTDLLGRYTEQINQPLFYIYDDGTVEKIIVIE